MSLLLEELFPQLRGRYQKTSDATNRYNCIAWAASNDHKWWWPDPMGGSYWPPDLPRDETVQILVRLYENLGFRECRSDSLEPGVDRVAIFALDEHRPTHAARQLPDGRWTSKLGVLEDVAHELRDLEGPRYGSVSRIMRRIVT